MNSILGILTTFTSKKLILFNDEYDIDEIDREQDYFKKNKRLGLKLINLVDWNREITMTEY